MTYELAKKLKDVGFPQKEEYIYISHGKGFKTVKKDLDSLVSNPNLSQLIEACGDRFKELYKIPTTKSWRVVMSLKKNEFPLKFNFDGKTPEEAVANLWLALNKNNK